MASGANAIGNAATSQNGQAPAINAFTQAVAHAVLGCVGAAATNGGGACAPGAAGAVVGELSAKYATEQLGMNNADALSFAKVMSATAGALVGGSNNATAVNVAATTGANAAANNALSGMPGNNQEQNKQVRAIVVQLKLNQNQQRELHDAITGQNYNYQQVLEIGKEIKNGKY